MAPWYQILLKKVLIGDLFENLLLLNTVSYRLSYENLIYQTCIYQYNVHSNIEKHTKEKKRIPIRAVPENVIKTDS